MIDSDEEMEQESDTDYDYHTDDDWDEYLHAEFFDYDNEVAMLSLAWSHKSDDESGTEGAPIDLTGSEEMYHLRSVRTKTKSSINDQLFSGTSDDEPFAPSQRVLDLTHSSDEAKDKVTTSSSE